MNLLDENSKNLELLYKTKNTKLPIYKFFPKKRQLTLQEKLSLISMYKKRQTPVSKKKNKQRQTPVSKKKNKKRQTPVSTRKNVNNT